MRRGFKWQLKHALGDLAFLVALRDRLRCPECEAVGTYKPHGGLIDILLGDSRGVRRWLCKWCGYYDGEDGKHWGTVDTKKGCWVLLDKDVPENADVAMSKQWFIPKLVLERHSNRCNPWRG